MQNLRTDALEVKLYKTQFEFVTCQDRLTAFIGGIGSGKTFSGAIKSLLACKRIGGLGLVVAPTYPMMRDATLRMFLKFLPHGVYKFNKSEMRVEIGNGECEVLFRSADNPNRLRNLNITWAWLDEAALYRKEAFDIVLGRLREGGKAGPCWLTATPKGRNWLYESIGMMTVFKARTDDNPFLSAEFVASLRASYHGQFARQELDAEFVTFEGLVFSEFDKTKHVCTVPLGRFVQVIAGVDEGYTNPAAILVIGLDADGRAHVIDEYYKRLVLQDTFIEEAIKLQQRYHITAFYVDPSAAGLIAAMNNAGLTALPARNEVREGIMEVQSRLAKQKDGRYRLTVSPSAVYTIAEFESYCWKQDKYGMSRDDPEKQNDHAMDALRYALYSIASNLHGKLFF